MYLRENPAENCRLVLYNCTGLRTKYANLKSEMKSREIQIAFLTETWLKQDKTWAKDLVGVSTTKVVTEKRGFAGTAFLIPDGDLRKLARTVFVDDDEGSISIIRIADTLLISVYLSPLRTVTECEEILKKALLILSKEKCNKAIMGGDFNMRHTDLGAAFCCKRGEALLPILQGTEWRCRNNEDPTHLREDWRPSKLDLFFEYNTHTSVAVPHPKMYLGKSAHVPVIMDAELNMEKVAEKIVYKRIVNVKECGDEEKSHSFESMIEPKLEEIQSEIRSELEKSVRVQGTSEELREHHSKLATEWDQRITKTIMSTAASVFGTVKRAVNPVEKIREDCDENCKIIFRRLQSAHMVATKSKCKRFTELRDNLEKQLNEARANVRKTQFHTFCDDIADLPKSQQLSQVSRFARKQGTGESKLKSDPASMEQAREYFYKMFNSQQTVHRHPGKNWGTKEPDLISQAMEIFDEDYMNTLIDSAPVKKAPGDSGLVNELVKACPRNAMSKLLCAFFQFLFITGTIPESWKKCKIVPVPKKGDLSLINNYRPISLLENIRKLYERCVLGHLQEGMAAGKFKQLNDEQGGFRAGRSTLDQAATLNEIIRAMKKAHRTWPVLAFLDIKAAYDSVDRSILLRKCEERGFTPQIVETVRQLFDFNNACVLIQGKTTQSFKMSTGVQQGSILSPLLYSIFIDDMRDVLQRASGLLLRSQPKCLKDMMTKPTKLNMLLYADDIVLFGRTAREVQEMLDLAHAFATENKFSFSIKKCVVMGTKEGNQQVRIGSESIPRVLEFKYLGITFSGQGIAVAKHIAQRVSSAKATFYLLRKIGLNYGGFAFRGGGTLYKSLLRTQIEYGVAILKLKKTHVRKLESAQHAILSGMISVHSCASSRTVRGLVDIEPMETRVKVLAERFRVRVVHLNMINASFLGRVIRMLHEVTPAVAELKLYPPETGLVLLIPENEIYKKANQTAIKIHLKLEKIDEWQVSKEKANETKPIWSLLPQEIKRLVESPVLNRATRRTILLYILKKIPGQGKTCKKCAASMTITHLIECNRTMWRSLAATLQKINKSPKRYNAQRHIQEGSVDGAYVSNLIVTAVRMGNRRVFKDSLEAIANALNCASKSCSGYSN
jgi:Reverse transcriptase (RNA-dependent DNA polymerase)/Endonuclease-reverse transcriptase